MFPVVVTPEIFTSSWNWAVPFTSNVFVGIALPRPTLPSSSTVTTFVAPSNKFTISAVPVCIPIMAVSELLFALISTRSTPVKFVSKVVVVPSTVKLLLPLKS